MTEREDAMAEAAEAEKLATEKRGRPRIVVQATNEDITEDVVSILDALYHSMDWGSGFLDDDETAASEKLMRLLQFHCGERTQISVRRSFWSRAEVRWLTCDLPYGHSGPHDWEPAT